eukprot:6181183-Pleurochrysis_carterae.AAC.1
MLLNWLNFCQRYIIIAGAGLARPTMSMRLSRLQTLAIAATTIVARRMSVFAVMEAICVNNNMPITPKSTRLHRHERGREPS